MLACMFCLERRAPYYTESLPYRQLLRALTVDHGIFREVVRRWLHGWVSGVCRGSIRGESALFFPRFGWS